MNEQSRVTVGLVVKEDREVRHVELRRMGRATWLPVSQTKNIFKKTSPRLICHGSNDERQQLNLRWRRGIRYLGVCVSQPEE